MTREQAHNFMWIENDKSILAQLTIRWGHHKTIRDLHDKLLDKIFDEHEAELQSEYRKLEGRDFMLSEMQKELKAKNEEIARLNKVASDLFIEDLLKEQT